MNLAGIRQRGWQINGKGNVSQCNRHAQSAAGGHVKRLPGRGKTGLELAEPRATAFCDHLQCKGAHQAAGWVRAGGGRGKAEFVNFLCFWMLQSLDGQGMHGAAWRV